MSKKKKTQRKQRKWEARADRRTAQWLARRFEEVQEELGDLVPDLQTFGHFRQISTLSWSIEWLKGLQKKYQKIADGEAWEDED